MAVDSAQWGRGGWGGCRARALLRISGSPRIRNVRLGCAQNDFRVAPIPTRIRGGTIFKIFRSALSAARPVCKILLRKARSTVRGPAFNRHPISYSAVVLVRPQLQCEKFKILNLCKHCVRRGVRGPTLRNQSVQNVWAEGSTQFFHFYCAISAPRPPPDKIVTLC